MPGTPNPFATPYANRDAAALLSAEKTYNRKTIADTNAILNGDWSGQFGGLHLLSDNSDWDIDTSDTTTANNADNQRDANGILFKRIAPNLTSTTKLVTATGDVTLADAESADVIEINNTHGVAINVYLPSAAVRTKPITIVDVGGNAATYPLTILPKAASGQTIMTGASYVIDSNGGGITLTPNSATTGYR